MGRSRLAVRFEDALCSDPVVAKEAPLPLPGALDHLIRCMPHYDVWIFTEGWWTAPMLDGWLLTELERHFAEARLDNLRFHALHAMRQLGGISEGRPKRADRFVEGPADWPSIIDTDALWKADAE